MPEKLALDADQLAGSGSRQRAAVSVAASHGAIEPDPRQRRHKEIPLRLVDNEGWLIGLGAPPVEVELIDDAGGDALVMLTEEEQEAVRARRKDVNHGIGIVDL